MAPHWRPAVFGYMREFKAPVHDGHAIVCGHDWSKVWTYIVTAGTQHLAGGRCATAEDAMRAADAAIAEWQSISADWMYQADVRRAGWEV